MGIDLSANHVGSAEKDAKRLSNLVFEVGDYQQLRFEEASFDAVFAVECLCQASDIRRALGEIFRVLRPGGRLVVIDCFRSAPLDTYAEGLRLATQLVEKPWRFTNSQCSVNGLMRPPPLVTRFESKRISLRGLATIWRGSTAFRGGSKRCRARHVRF